MADYETLYPGRFLKKETLVVPKVIRIVEVQQTKLKNDKDQEEDKVVIKFRHMENGKPAEGEMPWNKTNAALTAFALDERDYLKWINRLVTVFHDPSVAFGGKQVGGIRVCGSPEMKAAKRIEIKRPRRKKPDVYQLTPTDKQGNVITVAPSGPPPVEQPASPPPAEPTEDLSEAQL